MATKTFEELKQLAIQIRDEKTNKANTATRIGTQMIEHLNKLEQEYYTIQTVDGLVSEYNVSVNHPNSGINGSNKYTLSSAIGLVPEEYRRIGIKCSFINDSGDNEEWEYNGNDWTVDNFDEVGAKRIIEIGNYTIGNPIFVVGGINTTNGNDYIDSSRLRTNEYYDMLYDLKTTDRSNTLFVCLYNSTKTYLGHISYSNDQKSSEALRKYPTAKYARFVLTDTSKKVYGYVSNGETIISINIRLSEIENNIIPLKIGFEQINKDVEQINKDVESIYLKQIEDREGFVKQEINSWQNGFYGESGNIVSADSENYKHAKIPILEGSKFLKVENIFVASNGLIAVLFFNNDEIIGEIKDTSANESYSGTFVLPSNVTHVGINSRLWNIEKVNVYFDDSTKKDLIITDENIKDGTISISKLKGYNALGYNILIGKKWAVCGDSFSHGDFNGLSDGFTIEDGIYKGKNKVYGYLIGNRNNMTIQHMALGGRTLATPSDMSFTNSFTYTENVVENSNYTQIDEDTDYATFYFGINDSHHRPGSGGGDGEDNTGVIEIGTINDSDNTTFYGAWNVMLKWLLENRPFTKLGIIVSNGCETIEYRKATIEIAKRWGIPYIDLNGDERTPMMLRSMNEEVTNEAKNARLVSQRVSPTNQHPNPQAHEYESTFIENFLRSL